VLRAAARRLLILFAGVTGGTVVASVLIGLAAGSRITRAISTGFYVMAAALLVGCFVVGARGPLRPDWGGGSLIPRGVRRASDEERSDAVRTSVLLFAAALVLIVIGSLVDPDRRAF
jgi:hypothetical protein